MPHMPEAAQTDLFARPIRGDSRMAASEAPAPTIATSELILEQEFLPEAIALNAVNEWRNAFSL